MAKCLSKEGLSADPCSLPSELSTSRIQTLVLSVAYPTVILSIPLSAFPWPPLVCEIALPPYDTFRDCIGENSQCVEPTLRL